MYVNILIYEYVYFCVVKVRGSPSSTSTHSFPYIHTCIYIVEYRVRDNISIRRCAILYNYTYMQIIFTHGHKQYIHPHNILTYAPSVRWRLLLRHSAAASARPLGRGAPLLELRPDLYIEYSYNNIIIHRL